MRASMVREWCIAAISSRRCGGRITVRKVVTLNRSSNGRSTTRSTWMYTPKDGPPQDPAQTHMAHL
eukprot:7854593-Pyramimonas_sp.AAC.1